MMQTIDAGLPAIWERQAKESHQAFQAFSTYRDMPPPRSIRGVGQQLGKSFTLMDRWSRVWRWVNRADAYDSMIQDQAIEARIKAVQDMNVRHVNLAVSAQTIAARRIQQLLRQDPDGSFPELQRMSVQALATLMDTAVKLERLSRGETTENVGHRDGVESPSGPHPLTALVLASPESIRLAAALARSIGYNPGGQQQPALPPGSEPEPDRNDLTSFLGRVHDQE